MRPLASALAQIGVDVLVPDWDSTAADLGRAALLASLDNAVTVSGERPLVIIGWSLGGTAAMSVASLGSHRVSALVGLAADCEGLSPITGQPLAADGLGLTPVCLVHGFADQVVPAAGAIRFARDSGANLMLLHTDHAGVLGCEYDTDARVCMPSVGDSAKRGLRASLLAIKAVSQQD